MLRPLNVVLPALTLMSVGVPATALIVQGGDGSGIAVPTGVSEAFGQWGGNAAAIAVAPNWVLTTRHQDPSAAPDRTVTFGGQSFTALASEPDSVVDLSVDLRLVRIVDSAGIDANLTSTLQAYDGPPLTQGAAITLGGFGPTRGEPVSDGFDHAGEENNSNGLRFGTNTFERFDIDEDPDSPFEGLVRLVADFDPAGEDDAFASEATAGAGDSGGAWLVNDNGILAIAGLSHGISTQEDDPATPIDESAGADAFFGQFLVASDATEFASTINTIPEPATAALLAAALPLIARRRRRS